MFAYKQYQKENEKIEIIKREYPLTNILLEFTQKEKYDKLDPIQAHRNFEMTDPKTNIAYQIEFHLTLEDTIKAPHYLYQQNFDKLLDQTLYLWVCTVRTCKHNLISDLGIYEANWDIIHWHFVQVENELELTSKHKGLISQLSNKDFIVGAGEIYLDRENSLLYYNTQTGCIKKSMHKNSFKIGYSRNKPPLPSDLYFRKKLLLPLIKIISDGYEVIYDNDLRKTYAPPLTYDYIEDVCNSDLNLCYVKQRIE